MGPVAVSASRAAFAQVSMGTSVFCNRNATGAAARVLGTSGGVIEALAARIMSLNNRGLLNLLRLVTFK